jgi:fatty acid desaturase
MFFAPMNMNFHAAHHLWVSIPYYNLPKADALMRAHPLATSLEWRRSYVGYLIRYALALPLEECRVQNPAR